MKGVTSGLRAWLLQRATAVYLFVFMLLMPAVIANRGFNEYMAWRAFMAEPVVMIGWLLFFASLLAHAWVGIRDVVIDYVHVLSLRLLILTVLAMSLSGIMLWVLVIFINNAGVPA